LGIGSQNKKLDDVFPSGETEQLAFLIQLFCDLAASLDMDGCMPHRLGDCRSVELEGVGKQDLERRCVSPSSAQQPVIRTSSDSRFPKNRLKCP